MSFLRANFGTRTSGLGSAPGSVVPRRLDLDAAKLAGSIVVFKRGRDFIV